MIGIRQKKKTTKSENTHIYTNYDEYDLTKKESWLFYISCGLLLFVTGMLFYKNIIISVVLVAATLPLKKYYSKSVAKKRKAELAIQFKDLLYSLSASFATGRHMISALEEAYENLLLIYKRDDMIMVEIKHICDCLIVNKQSEEEVLYDFAKRSGINDIMNFIEVYFTCRNTGGDIQKVVNDTASVITDRIDISREIDAITAQKKYEARILTFIPLLLIAFLQLTSPDYIAPLYSTVKGVLIMTVCIGMIAVAFVWSMKISEIRV